MQPDYFQAVRWDGENAIDLLTDLDDINITGEEGLNLLHMAVAWKNKTCASELIKRGINLNHQENDGQTPLHYSAEHSSAEMAEAILSNGGDMNITDNHGNTPLWTAVFNAKGDYAVLRAFAKFDYSRALNIKNTAGRSPLDFAKQIGDKNIEEIFI